MQVNSNRRARVTVIQPAMPPVSQDLTEELITLGRAADCTIPIRDRFLSRRHAEIAFAGGKWIVRDCGSSNGTLLNGTRVIGEAALKAGDRITIGDTDVLFEDGDTLSSSSGRLIQVEHGSHATNLSISLQKIVNDDSLHRSERSRILNALALELIEDRPLSELFDFIVERVMRLMEPSRAALALLDDDRQSFQTTVVRHRTVGENVDLRISRTLLSEVVGEKKVVSFVDGGQLNEKLLNAKSIIGQSIRSAICAPLLIGDDVLGVLYLDFVSSDGQLAPEDVVLVGQMARFAAVKLETTRLREEAEVKAKIEEELRTAYVVQSRLLPAESPTIPGYTLAGLNRPCNTVSGDYYDYAVRPDGSVYFVIADVSGKGITAALIMASLATAFDIFTLDDPSPSELVTRINKTLAPKTSPTKFATLFAGRLHPETGVVEFTNAGHVPPLLLTDSGTEVLKTTDLVVGLFATAAYRDQSITLDHGEALLLFTDGVTEAANANDEELGDDGVRQIICSERSCDSSALIRKLESAVVGYAAGCGLNDDVTILALTRDC